MARRDGGSRRTAGRPGRGPGRIGLALGGGAARGWAHLGVLRALDELGVAVHAVAGTSMGALVGATWAAGGLDAVESLYRARSWRRWFTMLSVAAPGRGLMDEEKFGAILRRAIRADTLEAFPTPFRAVATDLVTGGQVVLSEGDPVPAVRASMSVPGLFAPVRDDARFLVDGGLVNPVPVDVVRRMGVDRVIAVDVSHRLTQDRPYLRTESPRLLDVLLTSIAVSEVALSDTRLERHPPDVLVRPAVGHVRFLDFGKADEVVAAGYRAGLEALRSVSPPLARTG